MDLALPAPVERPPVSFLGVCKYWMNCKCRGYDGNAMINGACSCGHGVGTH
jgi:hypothetical protein